ncbi:chromosome segregation protein SMC [Candidatus Woesearchaeota archaeon]|nr:chromosome segregation protein SMC [Candidatus Woesearchaeota archaeon]
MTRINRMVMKGFKSFGQKVALEFGSDFNCVLGPNGSGKSNIMDALCFVLGKGSAKGLRADKAANLIYNGGKKKEPANQGEVSIYFDNSSKTFPAEDEYVKITRIIKKTGQSVYKINDKTRTRQQILDLLSIANIEPDGYNIVLQGDIVRLVEMSTNERRNIVEDIAGISIYEEKKNKALKELEKVDEKINEAEIILAERKTYLKELKKDRDKAVQYKDIADMLQRSKATLCNMQISSRQEKADEIIKMIGVQETALKKLEQQITDLKKAVSEKKEEVMLLSKEIEEKGEKDQVRIMKEIEQLKIDIATNKTRISSNHNEILRLGARKDQLQGTLAELNQRINELISKNKATEKSKADNHKQMTQLEAKIKEFKKKHKIEDSEAFELDIDKIDKEAEDMQKEIQELREKQQEMLRKKDKIELYINSIDDRIKKVLEVEKEHKKDIERLKSIKSEFKKTALELNKLLNDDSSMAAQLGNARQKLIAARDDLSKLNARNAGLKQKAADSIAIKTILESKNRHGTIYGLVSELGQASSRYALALEIAAGNRLKSIVVDNDMTASKCIKHLKSNRLGTATFLPLNKIKSSADKADLKQVLGSNGVHGLAAELISYDPKFRNAFSYVFGNTVIVDNIDVARRIGIGSVRMVTLDGDLIEKSGAMHGGFRQKSKGIGFKEKEIVSEIREKEGIASDMESLVARLEQDRSKNEEQIIRLREHKAGLEGDIIKTEKSLHLDSGDLEASRKEKKEMDRQMADIDKEIATINSSISQCNSKLAQIKIKKQELRSMINEMRNPRLLAELNTFEQKHSELKEQVIGFDSDMRNIDMQIKNILQPEKEKTVKILSQHDKEEENFKQEQAGLKEKIKQQEKELAEKEKKQKEFYGKYKGLFTKKDRINEVIQKDEARIIKLEEQARSAEQKMNIHSIDKASIDATLAGLNEEFGRYKNVQLLRGKTEEELKKDVWSLERRMESAGNVNMRALEVYDQIEKEYNTLLEKQEKLKSEKEEVLVMINEIETKKKELFMKTYEQVDTHFRNMFSQLSSKGEAFLELENPKDPFSEGLCIKVKITGKKFLDIRSLSGGEKTLTALAFIFAIQEFEPASFYVLDEVDAALDKRNSEKLAELIKKYSSKAQYIIISHNDGLINSADTLYGVSMDEHGTSKVISLKV